MELVHTDSNFEPEESFFQLFSDPRSTRLTRVQLREDFVRDRDLEAIRKQVRVCRGGRTWSFVRKTSLIVHLLQCSTGELEPDQTKS